MIFCTLTAFVASLNSPLAAAHSPKLTGVVPIVASDLFLEEQTNLAVDLKDRSEQARPALRSLTDFAAFTAEGRSEFKCAHEACITVTEVQIGKVFTIKDLTEPLDQGFFPKK